MNVDNFSIEAEQSVIGGLMLKQTAWESVADFLAERDFYRAENQLIFRHIARLNENGKQVDVLTVAGSIESTGKLEKIGGLPYLGSLAQNTPSTANIRSYAEIVRRKRKERDFLAAVQELNAIAETNGEIAGKIENAVSVLNALADDKQNEPIRLSEAAGKAIETLDRRFASGGEIHGLKTGFIDFDRKTGGLHGGDLIILAGRPSSGKTCLATNIAEHVSVHDGLPVMMFSLEMSDEQLATRAIANQGGVSLNVMRSAKVEDADWDRLTHAVGKIADAPMFIDSNPATTTAQMHVRARRIQRKYGLSLIVIDYLQLMSDGGDNRNNELSSITRKLKLMAKDLNVPVLCLSQLSRKVEERADKRPMLSDLRDSGAIEQDADVVIMLYRDEYYNTDSANKGVAEANLAKQRMGETGVVLLTFQGEYSRFANFSGEYRKPELKLVKKGFPDKKQLSAEDTA